MRIVFTLLQSGASFSTRRFPRSVVGRSFHNFVFSKQRIDSRYIIGSQQLQKVVMPLGCVPRRCSFDAPACGEVRKRKEIPRDCGSENHTPNEHTFEKSSVNSLGFDFDKARYHIGQRHWFILAMSVGVTLVVIYIYNSCNGFDCFHVSAATKAPTNVVLLSCGSFNPPTIMHLRMFELAWDYLHRNTPFRVIRGVLSPVHQGYGKKGLAPAEHRISMVRLATKDSNWLEVDHWEATQACYCRTVVVMRHVRDTHKQRVMLLCGADLFKSFTEPGVWKPEDIEEILRDFGVVIITRAGTDLQHVVAQSDLFSRYRENIVIVSEKISNEISSTKIRQALRNGESVRYFVPEAILEYMREHELYCGSNPT